MGAYLLLSGLSDPDHAVLASTELSLDTCPTV